MICKKIFLIYTIEWSNGFISNNSIQHKSKYCYVSLTIQLNMSHLFTHS